MLLLQTILSIIYINTILNSSWFTLITFLIIVGGLLILIMYIRRVASNEKFKINLNISLLFFIRILYIDEFIRDYVINENQNLIEQNDLNLSLLKIYNMKSIYITLILVIYLLLTILSVSRVVKFFEGPLRIFSYE